jgi:peroxiredoxin
MSNGHRSPSSVSVIEDHHVQDQSTATAAGQRAVQEGDHIPVVQFKILSRKINSRSLVWNDLPFEDAFAKKRILLVGVPGAFVSEPSALNYIDEYINAYQSLLECGIDDVYCVAVNDGYVLREWGVQLELELSSSNMFGFAKLKLLPDASGDFTRAMGMCCTAKQQAYIGERASQRYAAIVDDMEIEKLFVEDEEAHEPNDNLVFGPAQLSSAHAVLTYLQPDIDHSSAKKVFASYSKTHGPSTSSFKAMKKSMSWNKKRDAEKKSVKSSEKAAAAAHIHPRTITPSSAPPMSQQSIPSRLLVPACLICMENKVLLW